MERGGDRSYSEDRWLLRMTGGPDARSASAEDYFLPGFFLPHDRATRALAGTSVRAGALAVDRQAAAVTQTLVAADLDLAADVGLNLATEVTLGAEVGVHVLADLDQVLFGQVANAGVGVHASGGENLLGPGAPDTEDVGEGNLHALFARDVNT